MTRKTRSLLGTIGIILVTIGYPIAVAALLAEHLARLPGWASVPIFAVLGLLWCLPTALLVRWMARPD
jgi:predicted ABC-type sugar transport system permease subunit